MNRQKFKGLLNGSKKMLSLTLANLFSFLSNLALDSILLFSSKSIDFLLVYLSKIRYNRMHQNTYFILRKLKKKRYDRIDLN